MRVSVGARGAQQHPAIVRLPLRMAVVAAAAVFAGCTTVPTGPSTLALPGSTKGLDEFRVDDGACRQYAYDSIGGQTAARAQEDSGARSVLAGAAIGAMIGAAVSGGQGAAVGAGIGGGAGGIAGVGASEASAYESQRRYDQAYTQCMYGKGHRVAVSGRFTPQQARTSGYTAPPRYMYGPPPPPPPGVVVPPPPPPPGYVPR